MAHSPTRCRATSGSGQLSIQAIVLVAMALLVAACAGARREAASTPYPSETTAQASDTPSPTTAASVTKPAQPPTESDPPSEELSSESSFAILASREFQALRLLDLASGETVSYPTAQWEHGQQIDLVATVNDQGMAALRSERAQLEIYQLPEPDPLASFELVDSSFFPPPGEALTEDFRQRTYAIRRSESQPRWSPDGSMLVFAAALDDGEVNPYLYELGQDQIAKLADLPRGSLPLDWFATGESLLVVSGDRFTTYSYRPRALHRVDLDHRSVRTVNLAGATDPLVVTGWLDQGQVLVAQRKLAGDMHSLTLVDFEAGSAEVFIEDRFAGAASADDSGSILVAGRADRPELIELYEIENGQIDPMTEVALEAEAGAAGYFPELGAYAVESSTGTVLVSQTGETTEKYEGARGLPYPSPDGSLIAFGPSTRFYDGELLVFHRDGERALASDKIAEDLIWWPDSKGLFFAQTVGSLALVDLDSEAVFEPWIERADKLRLLPQETIVLPSFDSLDVPSDMDGDEEIAADENQANYLGSGTPLMLTELQMVGSNQGWALGFAAGDTFERVLYTQDAGESWQEVTPPRPRPPSREDLLRSASGPRQNASLFALDGTRSWVSYGSPSDLSEVVVWRTVDGGSRWQASEPIDVTRGTDYGAWVSGFLPLGFEFVDDQVGWLYAMTEVPASMMAGDSILLRTENGGQSWRIINVTATFGYQGMHFFDRLNGYRLETSRVGDLSSVLRTLDGGEYWFQDPNMQVGRLPNIFDPEPSSCLGAYQLEELAADTVKMVQHCRNLGPETGVPLHNQLLLTTDAAQSWQSRDLPVDELPGLTFDTEFVDQQVGWLLDFQSGALQRTVDGGRNWNHVNTVTWEGELQFVDPLNGWAVAWEAGTNAFDREYSLLRTTNSGYSWELIRPVVK